MGSCGLYVSACVVSGFMWVVCHSLCGKWVVCHSCVVSGFVWVVYRSLCGEWVHMSCMSVLVR